MKWKLVFRYKFGDAWSAWTFDMTPRLGQVRQCKCMTWLKLMKARWEIETADHNHLLEYKIVPEIEV